MILDVIIHIDSAEMIKEILLDLYMILVAIQSVFLIYFALYGCEGLLENRSSKKAK